MSVQTSHVQGGLVISSCHEQSRAAQKETSHLSYHLQGAAPCSSRERGSPSGVRAAVAPELLAPPASSRRGQAR